VEYFSSGSITRFIVSHLVDEEPSPSSYSILIKIDPALKNSDIWQLGYSIQRYSLRCKDITCVAINIGAGGIALFPICHVLCKHAEEQGQMERTQYQRCPGMLYRYIRMWYHLYAWCCNLSVMHCLV